MQPPPPESCAARVTALITQQRLLDGVRRLGVAVSGGADSVALLRLLLPLCRATGIVPVVLHFDHRLRGAASAADARFVARLARQLGLACQTGRNRQKSHAAAPAGTARRTTRPSLEMAAREARQAFFRTAARTARLDAIATGHTADDVAETLLLRLARGSGAAGLSGLRPEQRVAGVRYIRPLLTCTHQALCDHLRAKKHPWREDTSNRDETIPRNRVRHVVLPWLEQHWSPSLRPMLVQSAAILRDEDALLEKLAHQELTRVLRPAPATWPELVLPAGWNDTVPLAVQRRVLRQWLLQIGGGEAAGWDAVEGLRQAPPATAWQVSLPGGVQIQLAHGTLRRLPAAAATVVDKPPAGITLPVPGKVVVAGVRVTAARARGILRTPNAVGQLPAACSLDAEALRGKQIEVRTRRPGDRIAPLGMTGSKSLQDLFVDARVPAAERSGLPLLVVDGEVVWVPGYRVARAYAVRAPRAAAIRIRMTSR
jgi:tRNA(Ile)-lysidine synthase